MICVLDFPSRSTLLHGSKAQKVLNTYSLNPQPQTPSHCVLWPVAHLPRSPNPGLTRWTASPGSDFKALWAGPIRLKMLQPQTNNRALSPEAQPLNPEPPKES